jgi:hypothetical protein
MSIGGSLLANGKAREVTFSAVVTRADGRVEVLGVVNYWHKNPLKRWTWRARRWMQRAFKRS